MKRIVLVRSKKFEAAFETNGRVLRTSKVLKFILGWDDAKVRGTFRKNKWVATMASPERYAELEKQLTESEGYTPDQSPEFNLVREMRFDRQGGQAFEHYCHCGKWAAWGFGVSILRNEPGQWFCREHIPVEMRAAA